MLPMPRSAFRSMSRSMSATVHITGVSRLLALALIGALAPSAARAATGVVPNANASIEGSGSNFAVFRSLNYTYQQVLGDSVLSAGNLTPGSLITGIGFRLNGGSSSIASISFADYDIFLGQLNSSITNPGQIGGTGGVSTTYANNYETGTRIQVRGTAATNDALTLTNLAGGSSPNPFFTLTFDTPYLYQGGGLVYEIRHTAGSTDATVDSASSVANSSSLLTISNNTSATASNSSGTTAVVNQFTFTSIAVPEPSTLALLPFGVLALAGAAGVATRRRNPSVAA